MKAWIGMGLASLAMAGCTTTGDGREPKFGGGWTTIEPPQR